MSDVVEVEMLPVITDSTAGTVAEDPKLMLKLCCMEGGKTRSPVSERLS